MIKKFCKKIIKTKKVIKSKECTPHHFERETSIT